MNFTREPIIETVITPKEGCKLVVRNSKGSGQEDYFVDAVEVVSFGNSFFFRSLERPKPFLVPVSDYEILELKETRMVLKSVGIEKIKIGGKKEGKQERSERPHEQTDKKRDRRRSRKRRPSESKGRGRRHPPRSEEASAPQEEKAEGEERQTSVLSRLFPPPPTLIKERLSRYKAGEELEEEILPPEEEPMAEDIPSSTEEIKPKHTEPSTEPIEDIPEPPPSSNSSKEESSKPPEVPGLLEEEVDEPITPETGPEEKGE